MKSDESELGLAICKQLVRLMDGEIAVESQEGQGATFRFTAVFDVQMPHMDGLETTRRIRRGAKVANPNIPIVAMTAGALREEHERCIAAGMNGFVSKPIAFHRVQQEIKTVLKRSG